MHENTLYCWLSDYEKYGERAFSGTGSHELASQKEVKRLEKENKKLKKELEILKSSKFSSSKIKSNLYLYQESSTSYFREKSCLHHYNTAF